MLNGVIPLCEGSINIFCMTEDLYSKDGIQTKHCMKNCLDTIVLFSYLTNHVLHGSLDKGQFK